MHQNDNRQKEYSAQLNTLRNTVNEYELTYNEKKKRFKYEIQLDQEKQEMEFINGENDISGLGGGLGGT